VVSDRDDSRRTLVDYSVMTGLDMFSVLLETQFREIFWSHDMAARDNLVVSYRAQLTIARSGFGSRWPRAVS